jgi:hypothetical protein
MSRYSSDVDIIYCNVREKISMSKLLQKLEQMDEKDIKEIFNLLPHEVNDLKDTLRRSNIYRF